jgi:type IV secretory pathway TrbD component
MVGQNYFFVKRFLIMVMGSARAIATLASVAAVVCSIVAFSWVGLALLGF